MIFTGSILLLLPKAVKWPISQLARVSKLIIIPALEIAQSDWLFIRQPTRLCYFSCGNTTTNIGKVIDKHRRIFDR